jgi:hypothetical protein
MYEFKDDLLDNQAQQLALIILPTFLRVWASDPEAIILRQENSHDPL